MVVRSLLSRLRRQGALFALLGLFAVLMQSVALARLPAPASGGSTAALVEVCTALGMATLDLGAAAPANGGDQHGANAHRCCDNGAPASVWLAPLPALAAHGLTGGAPVLPAGTSLAWVPLSYRAPPGRAPPRSA